MSPRHLVCVLSFVLTISGSAASERITKGSLITENVPEASPELTGRLLQYQNTRSAYLQSWHPTGQGMLIATRFGNTTQIHALARPGGARRQLTFFNEPVASASYSPNPDYRGFLFRRDVGGGEFYQYFWFDLATGRSRLLTDGKSRNSGAAWSN
ncbi:MAG: hypothetical protein KAX37_11705, partial [Opitutaceae bacterium]|nr:hypothetical protein [Opitutaceae bacterium]